MLDAAKRLCTASYEADGSRQDVGLRLARLLQKNGQTQDAIALLSRFFEAGVQAAREPLWTCLINERRFVEAAALSPKSAHNRSAGAMDRVAS